MNKFISGWKVSKDQAGFSLIELMIVVGIIGLLATLAFPKFQKFQAKARMAEARTNLSHIYTLEESYKLENDAYLTVPAAGRGANCATATMQTLGLEFSPCNANVPRYLYAITATADKFVATASSGVGAANLVCPGTALHWFGINHNRNFVFRTTALIATADGLDAEPSGGAPNCAP